jgi:hypothetical protein
MKNLNKKEINIACNLIQSISQNISDERAAKFGYDILRGLQRGNVKERLKSWEDYYIQYKNGEKSFSEEQRDGIWVPAISL